jgi:peptide/nickel transport system substrate-binding protein
MMRRRRGRRASVLALFALSLAACGDRLPRHDPAPPPDPLALAAVRSQAFSSAGQASLVRDAGPAQPGGTLVQAVVRDYSTLNNLLRGSANEEALCRLFLFPPLLDIEPDTLELVPLLAAGRPTLSADRCSWTWTIRPGVRWHRGTADGPVEVTAADFEFSWRMMSNPAVKAERARAGFGPVKDVKAIDRHTFTVTTTQPFFRLELEFGFNFRLMPAHLAASEPDAFNVDPLGRAPVGYGPYRFREWKAGEFLEFERNPDWPSDGRLPYPIERLRIRIASDATLWPQLLERGELSLCSVNDYIRWEELKADPRFREVATYHEYFLPQWLYVTWNQQRSIFSDVRVRRALTHLYPRERVREKVYAGHAVVLNAPGSVNYAAYDAALPPLPFDPGIATRLLSDAGWHDADGDGFREREGQPLRFTLRYPAATVPAVTQGNRWFQEEAKAVGVDVVLEPVDFEQLQQQAAAHDFDAILMSWVGDPRDDDLYDRFHTSAISEGANWGGYADPECDLMLEAFRAEFDESRRLGIGRAIYRKLAEDLPVTALYNPQALVLVSTRLRNVKAHRLGARWYDWWIAP